MLAYAVSSVLPQVMALFVGIDKRSVVLPLIWFGITLISLYIEFQLADLLAIWFAPGAFTALILSFFKATLIVQLGAFVLMTFIGLILSFFVIRPLMSRRNLIEKTNLDALEGKLALVVEKIDNYVPSGVVKINGQLWTARLDDDTIIANRGDWVEIVRVEGSKLICRLKS